MNPSRFELIIGYDGSCPLCNRFIRWVIRSDRKERIGISPLDGPAMRAVFSRHPQLAGTDSVVVVRSPGSEQETVETGPGAVLTVAGTLKGWWRLLLAGRWLPGSFNGWLYRIIARNRYLLVNNLPTCPLPDASIRSRLV